VAFNCSSSGASWETIATWKQPGYTSIKRSPSPTCSSRTSSSW